MGHNPNLDARLVKYLKERCKDKVDEQALELITEIEKPTVICETGWHAEYLLRRKAPHLVEYLGEDLEWTQLDAGDSATLLILSGYMKRFYGPLQTRDFMEDDCEYIVYSMDINSKTINRKEGVVA